MNRLPKRVSPKLPTFEDIAAQLGAGQRVRIHRFGTFLVGTRKARQIRNPATGELMRLPLTREVRFRPAKALRLRVRRGERVRR